MDSPFRVEVVRYSPGHSYDREFRVMLRDTEVAVYDATKVPVELVEWFVSNLNAEVCRLDLEPLIVEAA